MLDLTIDNNTLLSAPDNFEEGLAIIGGTKGGSDAGTLCLNILDNESKAPAGGGLIPDGDQIRQFANLVFNLQGYTGGSIDAYLQSKGNTQNGGNPTTFTAGTFGNDTCSTP